MKLLILLLAALSITVSCGEDRDNDYSEEHVNVYQPEEYDADLVRIESIEDELADLGIIIDKKFFINEHQVVVSHYTIDFGHYMESIKKNPNIDRRDIKYVIDKYVIECDRFLEKYVGLQKESQDVEEEIRQKVKVARAIAPQFD